MRDLRSAVRPGRAPRVGLVALACLALGALRSPAGDLEGTIRVVTPVVRNTKPRGGDAYGPGSTPQPGHSPGGEGAGPGPSPATENENVILFLKENVPGDFPPPSTRPEMAQVDANFIPRVLPVLVGTTVEFPNRDSIYHNIFSFSKTATFNLGRFPRPESRSHRFSAPGLVRVNCDIHAHMLGHILVLPHPYFATPGRDGSYRIGKVPPGSYNLVAWHDTLPPQVRPVTVPASGVLRADFQF